MKKDWDFKDSEIVFGVRAVMEAIQAGKEIEKVFLQNHVKGPLVGELRVLIKETQTPFQFLPQDAFRRFGNRNHQGVVALLSPISYTDLEVLVPTLFDAGKDVLILVLDKITDVRNFGAICRSAACLGADAIVIPVKGAARINDFALKTSAGALFHIPVCRVQSLTKAATYLRDSGIQLTACTEKAETSIYDASFDQPVALIMGSEEKGVSRELLELSEQHIRIPISGSVSSLNVSVATGIILSEVVRKRSHEVS